MSNWVHRHEGKKAHATQARAEFAVARLEASFGSGFRAYPCGGHWHVGSLPGTPGRAASQAYHASKRATA